MSGRFLDERNTPGDPITAELFNRIRSEIRRTRVVFPNAQQLGGPGGLRVLAQASGNQTRLCKTKTTITGRDGTTPGTGTVYLVAYDETELVTSDEELDILNWAAGSGAANKFGEITWIDGHWWLSALEC